MLDTVLLLPFRLENQKLCRLGRRGDPTESVLLLGSEVWSVQNPWFPFSPNSHDTSKTYSSVSLQLSQVMSISPIHSFNKYLGSPYCVSGLPSWLKESACNAGDLGSIPGLRRSPGGGHGNPLQYPCLENPHGQRSLGGYSPWGCNELDTTE